MINSSTELESERIAALKRYGILDTLPEPEFDDLTLLASQVCQTPISLISLIDADRQWFKSKFNFALSETPRDVSFCSQTIQERDILAVPNASQDARFADNPLVTGEPHIRFYAGAPLITEDGYALGALCVIDDKPRQFDEQQRRALAALARSVMAQIELRRKIDELGSTIEAKDEAVRAALRSEKRFYNLLRFKSNAPWYQQLFYYIFALFAIITAFFIKIWLTPYLGADVPFVLFFAAVLIVAWRGGLGPGLFATVLATLAADYFFVVPNEMFVSQELGANLKLLIFFAENSFICVMCDSLLRKSRALRNAHDELEKRVERRTKELQRAVKEAEDLYNNAPCGYHTTDANGVLTRMNDTELKWLGYTRDEVIGKLKITDIVAPENLAMVREKRRQLYAEGRVDEIELELIRKDKSVIPVIGSGVGVKNSKGEIVMSRTTLFDITTRRKYEAELRQAHDAALESTSYKSAFLANVSHEIRTPLNGVIGMTDLLLQTPLNSQQKDFAETIKFSGSALLTVISDILDFSKIEAGKLDFEFIEFDLRQSIEDTVCLLAETAHAKKLELIAQIEPNVPLRVVGDANRLRQVLLNLLSNSLKFTASGEVSVRVQLIGETAAEAHLRFDVVDTGIGINQAAQTKLFEPFIQADASTTRKFGGTGLGLTICKQLVEMMRGAIGVESEVGKGSKFWFTVRLAKQNQLSEAAEKPLPRALPQKLRILIVDDNAFCRRVLAAQMSAWGAAVKEVDNAVAAINLLQAASRDRQPFDIALLDFSMPDAEAAVLAQVIRANPLLDETKLVLLTDTAQTPRQFDEYFTAALAKPVRQSQLLDCLLTIADGGFNNSPEAAAIVLPLPELLEAAPKGYVLLVEDNPVNTKVAVTYLQKFNYRVETAVNGREALAAVYNRRFDLVLMDCQMPEMDGYETTAAIRACEARGEISPRTPIAAMTANVMEGDRDYCFAVGMDDYLSKPINADDLKTVLSRWCDAANSPKSVNGSNRKSAAPTFENQTIDLKVLESYAGLINENPEVFDEIILLFLSDAAENVGKMQKMAAAGNSEEVSQIAHKIRGGGGTFGAKRLSALCGDLENRCRRGESPNLVEAAQNIAEEFARVKEHFADFAVKAT